VRKNTASPQAHLADRGDSGCGFLVPEPSPGREQAPEGRCGGSSCHSRRATCDDEEFATSDFHSPTSSSATLAGVRPGRIRQESDFPELPCYSARPRRLRWVPDGRRLSSWPPQLSPAHAACQLCEQSTEPRRLPAIACRPGGQLIPYLLHPGRLYLSCAVGGGQRGGLQDALFFGLPVGLRTARRTTDRNVGGWCRG